MQSWAGSGGRAVCVMATLTSAGHLGVICGFRVVNTAGHRRFSTEAGPGLGSTASAALQSPCLSSCSLLPERSPLNPAPLLGT